MTVSTETEDHTSARPVLSRSRYYTLFWVCLVALALFGVAQASARLGHSLAIDEPFTAGRVHLPFAEMYASLRQRSPNPLHYLVLRPWARVFGESELALRSAFLLFFVLTVFAVGLTARKLAGARAGLLAGFFLTISYGIGLLYAATARYYGLLGLQTAVAMLLCIYFMQIPPQPAHHRSHLPVGRSDALLLLALIVVNVSGLLNHSLYVFVMCAYLFAAIFVSRRVLLLLVATSGLSAAIYLALWWPYWVDVLFFSREQGIIRLSGLAWMNRPDLPELARGFLHLWGWGSLPLALFLLGLVVSRPKRGLAVIAGQPSWVILAMLGVSSLLPFIVSHLRPVYHEYRTPIIFLPMSCVWLGIFISKVRVRAWVTAVVIALLALISVTRSVQILIGPDPYPVRQSVRSVAEKAQCGDIIVTAGLSWSEVEYYLRRLGASDCLSNQPFPQEILEHPGWQDDRVTLARRRQLTQEAVSLTAQLVNGAGSTVWFFYNEGSPVTDILRSELDHQLAFTQTLDLNGSFFDSVRVYVVP